MAWSRCCTTCRPATGKPANGALPATRIALASSRTASAARSSTRPRSAASRLTAWPASPPLASPPDTLHETFVGNLRFAADKLEAAGIRLLIEPINTFDIPGFYLNRTAQAIALIDTVGSGNLYLQHDIYHMQRMEGELANTIARHLPRIAHMQIADNPGRNEPGTGEINYAWLFRHIDQLGYDGWIGCEYKPAAGTREGLGWVTALAG